MARLTEETLNDIRNHVDIVEVVSEYVSLVQRGKNYFGLCPFHQDHSPSMSVSKEKQLFKCFSCGMAGNVFKFVSEIENISYLEAVGKMANKAGISVAISTDYDKNTQYAHEYEILRFAQMFFENNLNTAKGKEAKEYLNQRGLDEKMRKDFSVGLALDHDSLLEFFKKKKIKEKELLDLGLISLKDTAYRDIFIQRIMFPIHDKDGRVIGFTGRVYEANKSPKYLNSKETKLFRKGQILFNYHRAKEEARKQKHLILVEGNMDAIRMYESGFLNTVATMGTALTKEQIFLLQKLRVPLILMFDNDDAGELATYKNGELLEQAGIRVEVIRLTHQKDPDEYLIANGTSAMEDNLKHPISFLEFKMQYLKQNKNLRDTSDLAEYIKEVLSGLIGQDEITKEITLQKLVQDYSLSYDVLKNELEKKLVKKEEQETPVAQKKIKNHRYDLSAKSILYYMMNDAKYIKMFQNKLGYFKEELYRGIASEIQYYYEKNRTIYLADFLNYAEESPLKEEIYSILSSIKEEDLTDTSMEEYMNNIKEDTWLDKLSVLKRKLKETSDMHEKETLGLELTDIMKKIQEIRKERSVKE